MGEERFGNYSSCCRLCLGDNFNSLRPLFDSETDNRALTMKITNSLGIEVSPNDKISTMICNQCWTKVENWDSFKVECSRNQKKLEEWLRSWDASGEDNNIENMVVQIKDEPVDGDEEIPQLDSSEDPVMIKHEPDENGVEELYYEQPPQLTPHNQDSRSQDYDEHPNISMGSTNNDDNSQQSADSYVSQATGRTADTESDSREAHMQKIQFAAGLRLKRRSNGGGSSAPSSIEGPLTQIELAYSERSRALLAMLHRFRCACHNVSFPTVKRLFAHLRMSYTWFPIFTCYNCLITFATRSLNMRHLAKCPNPYLENSIRLTDLKKRTETKIRLYQYNKCNKCENLYAFYEDFRDHVEAEHANEAGPFACICSKVFESSEVFREHALICFLSYYCDICYTVFETVDDFRTHCEEDHDNIERFDFVTPHANFEFCDKEEVKASRKRTHSEMIQSSADTENVEDEGPDRKKFIPMRFYGETLSCEICDRKFTNLHNLRKHVKMHRRSSIVNGWKSKPSTCSKCGKVFSTYYNMIRHYKVHDEAEKHLQCALCPEKFRLVSEMKDHLILDHGRAHVCQECGRQFESTKELEQHRSVHLNIKVYRDSKTQSYRTGSKPRYSCDYCDAIFETEQELTDHSLVHNEDEMQAKNEARAKSSQDDSKADADFGRFSCNDCDRHYVSYKGLWLHNRRHHPERKPPPQTFPCQYCDRTLQTNAAYAMHKQMHERMLQRMQQQQNVPPQARKRVDDDESYFTCKHCFKVFSNKYNLKTHLKTHGIFVSPGRTYSKSGKFVKTFWCDICHQACQGYSELQKHKQEHIKEKLKDAQMRQQALPPSHVSLDEEEEEEEEGGDVKPVVHNCDICSKGFLSKSQLLTHKASHGHGEITQAKRNFVYCKYCKIPFLNVEGLNRHMLNEHNEARSANPQKSRILTKKHACNLCKKVFDTAGALCSHQGWHKRGKSDKQLKADKLLMQQTVQSPQQNRPKHDCSTCGLSFLTDTALQIHILEAHRNVNTHVLPSRCTICNIEFKTQAGYDEHARLHRTTSTTFQCKYCTKKFNKSETFNVHVNEAHPEYADAKFKCHQCERIFEKQNALTIHLKVHDRQRLTGAPIKQPKSHVYTCSICYMGFEIPKDLRNHIITSHPF